MPATRRLCFRLLRRRWNSIRAWSLAIAIPIVLQVGSIIVLGPGTHQNAIAWQWNVVTWIVSVLVGYSFAVRRSAHPWVLALLYIPAMAALLLYVALILDGRLYGNWL